MAGIDAKMQQIFKLISDGQITLKIEKRFTFDELLDALYYYSVGYKSILGSR